MKKLLIGLAVLAVGMVSMAEEPLVKCGGKGRIALVNSCPTSKVGLENVAKKLEEILLVRTSVVTSEWSVCKADGAFKKIGANIAVFVVNEPTYPISLVAHESRWAMVNASGLSEKAVSKEVLRVVSALMSGMSSQHEASALRPAFSKSDLENKVGDALTLDIVLPILNGLTSFGLEQYSLMTREEAIAEGYIKK